MKNFFLPLLVITFLSFVSTSCVSYRKYEDAIAARDQYQSQLKRQTSELEQANQLLKKLQEDYSKQSEKLTEVHSDLRTARERYDLLDRTNRDLLERYDRMLKQNEQLLQTSSDEKQQLLAELTAKQIELDRKERALKALEAEIAQRESDVTNLQASLHEREQKVNALESAIADKEAMLSGLKEKINNALLGFSDTDLSVREENGKVYVSLSQNLLFSSGSKSINAAGKEAITKLAQVLKVNPDIDITVEGHTDTDGETSFNWDLSVGRATSVVKELTKNGVNPKRITAAGRGEFYPIASNSSSSGKAQNRRTEIILTPKLDALYNLLNN